MGRWGGDMLGKDRGLAVDERQRRVFGQGAGAVPDDAREFAVEWSKMNSCPQIVDVMAFNYDQEVNEFTYRGERVQFRGE